MKSYPLTFLFLLALLSNFIASAARAENLEQYTARCETELEIPKNSITGFDCSTGLALSVTQLNTPCDSKALLKDIGCLDNSRLGVQTYSNPDTVGIWICRKYAGFDNPADQLYHDVAMIVHNRKNGKTCFFQNNLDPTSDGPIIPPPNNVTALSTWKTPQQTSADLCTQCHLNDPFIVTPHVAQAFATHNLTRFNTKGLYSVIGPDFVNFTKEIKRTEGCGGLCHFASTTVLESDASLKKWMAPGQLPSYFPFHFKPVTGQFYSLHSNGQIKGFNGINGGSCNNNGTSCPHWSLLDTNANIASIVASTSRLFKLHNDGKIFEFAGVPCSSTNSCTSWRLLDNNPNTAEIVSGGGFLYQRWKDGKIWLFTGIPCATENICLGWIMLDDDPRTVEIVAEGNVLYQRLNNGDIWKFINATCLVRNCVSGWKFIVTDINTSKLITDGVSLYRLQQSGELLKQKKLCNPICFTIWQQLDAENSQTKQVVTNGDVYLLYHTGEIWQLTKFSQDWELIDNNPNTVEIEASADGLLQRHKNGVVWRFTGTVCQNNLCPGWMPIQNFTDTVSLTGARL